MSCNFSDLCDAVSGASVIISAPINIVDFRRTRIAVYSVHISIFVAAADKEKTIQITDLSLTYVSYFPLVGSLVH